MSLIQIRKRSLTVETQYHEGGPPVALPPPDDFPAVGFVENDVVARAHAFTEAESPTLEDPDLDQVLVDLAEWLAVAASRGWGLVAFYA